MIFLLILLIIIIILFFIYQLKLKDTINMKTDKNEEYELGNHSIYKDFYYPQISIILMKIESFKDDNNTLFDVLVNLKSQKLKDIQIIISSIIFIY